MIKIILCSLLLVFSLPAFSKKQASYQLLDYVNEYAGGEGNYSPLLFPFGRSPEGQQSDFKNPRIVISFDGLQEKMKAREFMAYSKNENKFQAIQWNEESREFDFLVDTNYNGQGKPNPQKVDSNSCIVCHQNGAAVFMRGSWSESSEFEEQLIKPNAKGETVVDKLRKIHGKGTYLGFPVEGSGRATVAQVDSAAKFMQAIKVCNSACGENKDCRRAILKKALTKKALSYNLSPESSGLVENDAEENIENKNIDASLLVVKNQWPQAGYAFPDWSVGDRQGLTKYDATSNTDNPRTKRPLINAISKEMAPAYISDVAADCMGLYRSDLENLQGFTPQQIESVLDSEAGQQLISQWPPSRKKIMSAVMRKLKPQEKDPYCDCNVPKVESPIPTKTTEQLTELSTALQEKNFSELRPVSMEHFKFYCGKCHSDSGEATKFPMNSEEEFRKFLKDKKYTKSFEKKLKNKQMPPSGPKPPDDLNNLLIKWLTTPNN